jgi:hypothetical protein
MYYEVYDDLVFSNQNNKALPAISLINKSYLDIFFDGHSFLGHRYSQEHEVSRLVQKSNPFLFYQKLILGVSKGTFLGFNVFRLPENFFTDQGRIKVPEVDLEFVLGDPCLLFTSKELRFETSQFQKWEDELFKIEDSINTFLNVKINSEGFKANLYRTLEIMYAMKSSAPKRRTNWTVFLHELIVHKKVFTKDELASRFGFLIEQEGEYFRVTDPLFPTHHHLEFQHQKSLGRISTRKLAETLDLSDQSKPITTFSRINEHLLGKIPLCHFHLNEHMFVYKEEFELNQYYDFFMKPWTGDKNLKIIFRENETNEEKSQPFSEFARELRKLRYSLVEGFVSEDSGICYSAEPKMVKDLSLA